MVQSELESTPIILSIVASEATSPNSAQYGLCFETVSSVPSLSGLGVSTVSPENSVNRTAILYSPVKIHGKKIFTISARLTSLLGFSFQRQTGSVSLLRGSRW